MFVRGGGRDDKVNMFQALIKFIDYWNGNTLILSVLTHVNKKYLKVRMGEGYGQWDREGREGDRDMSATEPTRY